MARRTSHAAAASAGRQKLVDRAKLVLSTDPARRWTLAAIAAEVGVSEATIRARYQRLCEDNILQVTGVTNPLGP